MSSDSNLEVDERAMIVSSDGHAVAKMADYLPYMPAGMREEFKDFCRLFEERGRPSFSRANVARTRDPEVVDEWVADVLDTGRVFGLWDLGTRFTEMDRQGIAAEVVFPDFGRPFELGTPDVNAAEGYVPSEEQTEAGNFAYNRWLADLVSNSSNRLVGMAVVSFRDVEATIAEIRWAKDAGLHGIVLPFFRDERPLFDPCFDPVWSVLEELGMPVNSHIGISSTTIVPRVSLSSLPHPAISGPLSSDRAFYFCREIMAQFIWGGVFERHPSLQLVLTEQQTDWVVGALQRMDHTYDGSHYRSDTRDVIKRRPSEYFARQCHMGSSIFSSAEASLRHLIGVDKIQIGVDYPHHEGTWAAGPGTLGYLRATLGATGVEPSEARLMLGENAVRLWGLDRRALQARADHIGPKLCDVLQPPEADLYPRGDVHRPAAVLA